MRSTQVVGRQLPKVPPIFVNLQWFAGGKGKFEWRRRRWTERRTRTPLDLSRASCSRWGAVCDRPGTGHHMKQKKKEALKYRSDREAWSVKCSWRWRCRTHQREDDRSDSSVQHVKPRDLQMTFTLIYIWNNLLSKLEAKCSSSPDCVSSLYLTLLFPITKTILI